MKILYIGRHSKMYQVDMHTHDYTELVYCTGGGGEFRAQGETLLYQEGELSLIPAGLPHCNLSQAGFSNLYVAVERPPLPAQRMLLLRDSENRDLGAALSQLHYYFNLSHGQVTPLVTSLTRLAEEYLIAFGNTRRASPEVEYMAEKMVENFSDPAFSVEALVPSVPLNPEYARKLFTKEKGISPCKFLLQLRLEHARSMLLARKQFGLSIAQIADACGFADPLYFSRVFRRHTGCSFYPCPCKRFCKGLLHSV